MGITDPTQEYFKDGGWVWNGTEWVKSPIVFGYSDQYLQYETKTVTVGGANGLVFETVQEGDIWVVTMVSAYSSTANPSHVLFRIEQNGVLLVFLRELLATAGVTHTFSGHIIMKPDDFLEIRFLGCSVDDVLYGYANGYKMTAVV